MAGMQWTNHDTVSVIDLHMQRCERDRSPHQGVVGVRAGEVCHQPRFVLVPNLVMVVRMSAWVVCVQRVYVITVNISPWGHVLRVRLCFVWDEACALCLLPLPRLRSHLADPRAYLSAPHYPTPNILQVLPQRHRLSLGGPLS